MTGRKVLELVLSVGTALPPPAAPRYTVCCKLCDVGRNSVQVNIGTCVQSYTILWRITPLAVGLKVTPSYASVVPTCSRSLGLCMWVGEDGEVVMMPVDYRRSSSSCILLGYCSHVRPKFYFHYFSFYFMWITGDESACSLDMGGKCSSSA